jgi:hypothetical protein
VGVHGRSDYEAGEAVASSDIFLTMGNFLVPTFLLRLELYSIKFQSASKFFAL